jgi:predicted metal-dependent phosphoesterase TrpH
VGTAEAPLYLGEPATLTVQSTDGHPFAVRIVPTEPDAVVDARIIQPRPDGLAAAGWSRDGAIELVVEPGTYEILALRGLRYEVDTVAVTVAAGEQATVDVSLPAAFDHAGWTVADPHMHASPSADGEITMADRLVVSAALGIQVHFGTDHDHVADYRPLVEALGLRTHLRSVVADEVSPPMRGHFNIYPIEPIDAPNGGAWTWWTDIPEDTETMVAALRQLHGDAFTLQANHPTDAGIATLSDWTPGKADADRWTTDLGAIEVLNAGSYDEFLAFYLDLLQRGYVTTPTGVSDSHGHFSSSIGLSTTFFGTGSDAISDWSDDGLREALAAHRTVVSRGVFLATSIDPGSEVSAGAVVEVEARSASWARVDRLSLLRDGLVIETVDGDTATFVLDPEVDATYFVVAEGDEPMSPLSSRTPWAMTSAWRVDTDGNGWSPPLAPLTLD